MAEEQQIEGKSLLVTGGAGFIGSHFIRFLLKKYRNIKIINLDKLTYALASRLDMLDKCICLGCSHACCWEQLTSVRSKRQRDDRHTDRRVGLLIEAIRERGEIDHVYVGFG